MSGHQFILSKRAFTIFLSFLLATGFFLGMPAASRTLADSSPPSSREASVIPAGSAAEEEPLLDFSGYPALLQSGIGGIWTETNTPIDEASTPTGLYGAAMTALPGGNAFLFGGFDNQGESLFGDTWIFNTQTNTWGQVATPSAPTERAFTGMATLPGGNVLLFGGWGSSGLLCDTWLFNTTTNTWSQVATPSAPAERYLAAMASTSSGAVLFGGWGYERYHNDTWLFRPGSSSPALHLTSPLGRERWTIGSAQDITWTATDLDGTPLTILLARNGVDFTETLTTGVEASSGSWTWTVTGPGTINAKVRLVGADCQNSSPAFFTLTSTLFPYSGTSTLTTSDPWLEISGGSGTGTFWVTPLTPANTSDPNLNLFIQETGKRSALFFDIGQEGLSGTLTVVLHYTPQLGEETFVFFRWDGTKWVEIPGTLNVEDHTFTFSIDAFLLNGTPFALGGDPAAMPSLSPWALALLSLALLGMTGWWFLRRRRLA